MREADAEMMRYLGGSNEEPTAVIVRNDGGQIVGWVDHDDHRDWLEEGEVNVGYATLPGFRGLGYARRGVELFLAVLGDDAQVTMATLLIDPANVRSLAVANRLGFDPHGEIEGCLLYTSDAADE